MSVYDDVELDCERKLKVAIARAEKAEALNRKWNIEMGKVLAGSEYIDCPERYVERFRQLTHQVVEQVKKIKELNDQIDKYIP